MPVFPILAALAIYFVALFVVAWLGERQQLKFGTLNAAGPNAVLVIYSLSLAVYCTSWTFYGAVGSAAASGWEYLPIYLGPILVFTLFRPLVQKLVDIGKQQNSTSISDFLSARYGRSRSLAALVTIIATVGAIPYFALQLRSVTFTLQSMTDTFAFGLILELYAIAALLALFAIVFGTRHLDVITHNRGMIAAIALDSVIKLLALIAVGILAVTMLGSAHQSGGQIAANPFTGPFSIDRFLTLTILSMAAILCLPRQFHVMIVECQSPKSVNKAGVGFVAYLFVVSALVIPITLAGLSTPATATQNPDLFVLALPAAQGNNLLYLFTFIGGFAAATAMIVVGGVALSTMITNDILVPVFLYIRKGRTGTDKDLSQPLLLMRRLTIIVLVFSAATFAAYVPSSLNLASLGIISFAAAAQFAPALIGSLYWRNGTRAGVNVGLIAGFTIWLFSLLLPSLFDQPSFASALIPFGWNDLTNGTLLSLAINTSLYISISNMSSLSLGEKVQASYFVNPASSTAISRDRLIWRENLTAGDLRIILDKCLGPDQADKSFEAYRVLTNKTFARDDAIDADFVRFAEKQIARTLGASSARILLTRALAGRGLNVEDVVTLLDETSQILHFNQELLQTTLENIPQGVSVVDKELKLVAWNSAYLKMYTYPEGFIHTDKPVEEIIRYNAEKGEFGEVDVQEHIRKRLMHLRAGREHTFERYRSDGTVIKIQGRPIPGGGYVTTFTDITEYKRIETALRESEESIRFYTDTIPFPVAYTDTQEVIQFSNAAYRKMFGDKARYLRGKKLDEILSAQEYQARAPFIMNALAGNRISFDIEKEYGGKPVSMQVSYVPQYTESGTVAGFFGLYQDITERRMAEAALRETNETLEDRVRLRTKELEELNEALDIARQAALNATRSKTRFLAAASHDVLQPLNAARLFNSALISDLEAVGQSADLARKVEQSIASADLLLKTLLNISKLDAGGVTPTNTTFALETLLQEISEEFKVLADEKGLTLRTVSTRAKITTDRGLLRSVLQNLVSNAIRYTTTGGVLIGCRHAPDNHLLIQVCDTGIGIPANKQQDIFKEFTRLDYNQSMQGIGLGLATVERICRLLEHDITVSSSIQKGSVFSIRVPISDQKNIYADKQIETNGSFGEAVVLCVDNDAQVLEAMGAMLKRWGLVPVLAHGLDEVISLFPAGEAMPSMMLLDYRLDNDETGLDVLDYFNVVAESLPAAALLTAEESNFVKSKADKYDIPILMKPVEPAILRAFLLRQSVLVAE